MALSNEFVEAYDWQIPMWGAEASVDKAYVQQNMKRRDSLTKLFAMR